MSLLTVESVGRSSSGTNLAGVAATAGGDTFINTGSEVLIIKNGDSSGMTLTVVTPVTVDGQAVPDETMAVAAGETRMVGPFPPGWFNDTLASGGVVSLTYSSVTSLTVKVVRVAVPA